MYRKRRDPRNGPDGGPASVYKRRLADYSERGGKGEGIATAVVVAALAAVIVLGALALSGVFWRGRDEPRLLVELEELGSQLETLAGKIDSAVHPGMVAVGLGEAIGSTIELDEVLRRTLAAAGALPAVDGSEIIVPLPEGGTAREARGVVPTERRAPHVGLPEGHPYRSALVSYAYVEPSPDDLHSALTVPVARGTGTLSVYSRLPNSFDEEAVLTLETVARRAESAIENAIRYIEMERLTVTDSLTGLLNRRGYDASLDREVAISRRTGRPLALMIVDIDHFSRVNQEHDLPGGDAVLVAFAACIRSAMRATDIACRRGGEEFAIVLPETTCDQAVAAYERLRLTVAATPFPYVETLTFSAGISDLRADDAPREIDGRASAAEGRSKAEGRNRLSLDCLGLTS